jgi:hypothetical protein
MSVTITYPDFVKIFRVDDPSDFAPNLHLRLDGVYIAEPPPEALAGERAALTDGHPTGKFNEPALILPCDLPTLRNAVERLGLIGHIDPFAFADVVEQNSASARWPWGRHETRLLKHLAAAADRFWKAVEDGGTYNPRDKSTAPRNEDVEAWLTERGVTPRTAQGIATILREDDLPRGRRGE